MPIDSLSYSDMVQLLRNPLLFKLKKILGVYDGKYSMSAMIGIAGHKALEVRYGAHDEIVVPTDPIEARGVAKDHGLDFLAQTQDEFINFGKTGSREEMLKRFTQAMDFYFAEEPEYHELLFVEQKFTAELTSDNGQKFPLPAVGKPDIVHRRKDGIVEIIDTKFTKNFTSYDKEDYIKIIQSQFLYHLLLAAEGIKADRMLFREIKTTQNRDGSPQIRDWMIPFDHEPYKVIFINLFKDVVKFVSNPDAVYLPNLGDPMDGEHAGMIYAQGLISSDMSDVEVIHKVKDVARVTKQFVASRLDRAENKHLPPDERIKVLLYDFGIPVKPVKHMVGGSFTQYRFEVSGGVRMSQIKKHKDDIARAVEAKGEVRILAPIPGTGLVGVEVENEERKATKLTAKYLESGTLSLPLGLDVSGKAIQVPLESAPHLLIGGASGSGKSVLLHSIITALTKQMSPEQMEMVLIDPKRVELAAYAKKKHVRGGRIIFNYEDALRAILGLTEEMDKRYDVLEKAGKRDITEYNDSRRSESKKLPNIVVVVDEFADFMLTSRIEQIKMKPVTYSSKSPTWLRRECEKRMAERPDAFYIDTYKATKARMAEVLEEDDEKFDEWNGKNTNIEQLIVRLASLGRAAGIHLIIATQHPKVEVITGLIKANFPTRVALTTASRTDSEVILGHAGAEKLAGKGDMIVSYPGFRGDIRVQGFAK